MSAQQQHSVWTAFLSASTGPVAVGSCICLEADGEDYVIASLANRAAAGRTIAVAGIAITAGDADNRAIEIQTVGPCPPSITRLTAGAQGSIIVNDSGLLARSVSPSGSDIVAGKCDADGWAYLNFCSRDGAGGAPTSPGGNNGDTQYKSSSTVFGGAPFAIPFEFFGGVGDGSTDNAAAFAAFITAATTAAGAGRPIALALGSGTYVINSGTYTLPPCTIVGQGRTCSTLKYTADAIFLKANSTNTQVRECAIVGDNGTSAQIAIQCGEDGVATMPAHGVVFDLFISDCYQAYLFTNGNSAVHDGPTLRSPEIKSCNIGIQTRNAAEYVKCSNPKIYGTFGTGYTTRAPGVALQIESGNFHATGVDIADMILGLYTKSGSNSGHGKIVGGQINHCASPIKHQDTSGNGFVVQACDIYGGQHWIDGGTYLLVENCNVRADVGPTQEILVNTSAVGNVYKNNTYTVNGHPTVDIDSTSSLEFIGARDLSTTGVPTGVSPRVQLSYAFGSDADAILTPQQATAETIIISGSLTATRSLTIPLAPGNEKSKRRLVKNTTGQSVTLKFSSGSGYTLGSGLSAIVTSDGTNAIKLLAESVPAATIQSFVCAHRETGSSWSGSATKFVWPTIDVQLGSDISVNTGSGLVTFTPGVANTKYLVTWTVNLAFAAGGGETPVTRTPLLDAVISGSTFVAGCIRATRTIQAHADTEEFSYSITFIITVSDDDTFSLVNDGDTVGLSSANNKGTLSITRLT